MRRRWVRVEAGDYVTQFGGHLYRGVLVDGNWHLKIDGKFRGYYGRLHALKAAVDKGEDHFGRPLIQEEEN